MYTFQHKRISSTDINILLLYVSYDNLTVQEKIKLLNRTFNCLDYTNRFWHIYRCNNTFKDEMLLKICIISTGVRITLTLFYLFLFPRIIGQKKLQNDKIFYRAIIMIKNDVFFEWCSRIKDKNEAAATESTGNKMELFAIVNCLVIFTCFTGRYSIDYEHYLNLI